MLTWVGMAKHQVAQVQRLELGVFLMTVMGASSIVSILIVWALISAWLKLPLVLAWPAILIAMFSPLIVMTAHWFFVKINNAMSIKN